MRLPRRDDLTYANVMATVAVFLALGGTSYAVARNSVGTPQLKNGAVTSEKVRDGSLAAADFEGRALPRGPRGPQGPTGPTGPAGAAATLPAAEAWKPLAMQNLFDRHSPVFGAPEYRKDGFGRVYLRGLVTRRDALPTSTIVMATLPGGYRPRFRVIFVVQTGEPNGVGRVDVFPSGDVVWMSGVSGELDYTSLDGISFDTD